MRLKPFHYFIIVLASLFLNNKAQASVETDYNNYLYYDSYLNHVRKTADRKSITKDEEVFSFILDGRYGKSPYGNKFSFMFGGAKLFGETASGLYGLLYSSDMGSLFTNISYDASGTRGLNAASLGVSLDLWNVVILEGDITWALGHSYIYARAYVPFIKSSIGFGFSPFDVNVYITNNTVVEEVVQTGGSQKFNVLKIDSGILKYLYLGLDYFMAEKTVSPRFFLTYHQFVNPEDWVDIPFDILLFIRPTVEFSSQKVSVKQIEVRLKAWWLPSENWGFGQQEDYGMLIARGGIYAAVSYKSPVEGQDFAAGESGLGFEIGFGYNILDEAGIGMKDDFLNLGYFINFSEYFSVTPTINQGLKFLIYV